MAIFLTALEQLLSKNEQFTPMLSGFQILIDETLIIFAINNFYIKISF